jgi:hypothetical protein
MENILRAVPAHFDGKEIKLHVPLTLQPDTPLLVVILDSPEPQQGLVYTAMATSEKAFKAIWENDEDAVYDAL